jgi:hypothetical protein
MLRNMSFSMPRTSSTLLIAQLALSTLLTQSGTPSPTGGCIVGTVTDDSGKTIPGLTVLVQPQGEPRTVKSSQSDLNGHFRVDLDFGKYVLLAKDEQGKFSDCTLIFFSCDVPSVELSGASSTSTVVIKTRHAARIHGTIKELATGTAICDAVIVVRRGDNFFKAFTQTVTSDFSFIVPADVDLTFSITAIKYRRWIYLDPNTNYATFRLAPGQDLSLDTTMMRIDP